MIISRNNMLFKDSNLVLTEVFCFDSDLFFKKVRSFFSISISFGGSEYKNINFG